MPVSSRRLAWLIAALSALGPFSIDAYLPAFPAMGAALAATPLEIQQTLTAYMATFAVMVLWHGALADRFGRRGVILVACGLFAAASLVCAAASSIEWLWIGRALQGMSAGAGMVVGRAVIRDLHEGAQAQRLMARVTVIFGIAPAVAPLVGGLLLTAFGWRSIFVFLALFGAALVWFTWRALPETLAPDARQPLHPVSLARAYGAVLGSAAFLLVAAAIALNFNGFFLYVLAAPRFVMEHLGLGHNEFAWLFVPAVGGFMAGAALSGRLAGRWSPLRTVGLAFALMLGAAAANVAISALVPPGLPWSVAPIVLYSFGMSLGMPSMTLIALDLFPARRGLASSCLSFLHVGLNALVAGALVPVLWGSPLTLAAGMSGFVALGLVAFLGWQRRYGASTSPVASSTSPR